MGNISKANNKTANADASSEQGLESSVQTRADGTVEVLYQRMGNRWFAFSIVDDEVFAGAVPDEAIAASAAAPGDKVHRRSGRA